MFFSCTQSTITDELAFASLRQAASGDSRLAPASHFPPPAQALKTRRKQCFRSLLDLSSCAKRIARTRLLYGAVDQRAAREYRIPASRSDGSRLGSAQALLCACACA